MKVNFISDASLDEPEVFIKAKSKTEEIISLMNRIEGNQTLIVKAPNKNLQIIKINQIDSIYSSDKKVYIKVENEKEEFVSSKRLYELEEILPENFVRISNSEIINFDKIEKIGVGFIGTLKILFNDEYETYTSRRYVQKIKEYLKIK